MTRAGWVFALACALLLAPLWQALWRAARRAGRGPPAPFAAAARMQLARDCALYRRLPAGPRARVDALAVQFLARHRFRGCQGLVVSASMARLVSVQAALLVLGPGIDAYDGLGAVLLYPEAFLADQVDVDEAGVVSERGEEVAGQTVPGTGVLLSWPDVLEGARAGGPYNVAVHEFAHYLDQAAAGALSSPDDRSRRRLLAAELRALRAAAERGEPTLIDPYGALDEAEFFAVATEHFLGEPRELRERHPQLHALLAATYGFDPAGWPAA